MTKCKVVGLFLTVAIWTCIATAQSSPAGPSSPKAAPDPLQSATKPLTPKSAMPAHRKSSTVAPNPAASGKNTTAELTRLEQQNIKAGSSSSSNKASAKSTALPKPASTSAGNGQGINFKYQKPVGGMKATNPNANAPSSGTNRVKKN
jgi:hypothetical protein